MPHRGSLQSHKRSHGKGWSIQPNYYRLMPGRKTEATERNPIYRHRPDSTFHLGVVDAFSPRAVEEKRGKFFFFQIRNVVELDAFSRVSIGHPFNLLVINEGFPLDGGLAGRSWNQRFETSQEQGDSLWSLGRFLENHHQFQNVPVGNAGLLGTQSIGFLVLKRTTSELHLPFFLLPDYWPAQSISNTVFKFNYGLATFHSTSNKAR